MILHADGNSFYASCEQIFRPDLRGKAVVVLSNNDGVIIALNKEAKAVGLKRGDVFFKVRDLCRLKNVAVFSSNYTLYADISRRITSIYMEYAPQIEEYSIDESFLFFDDCNFSKKDYEEICHELKSRIMQEIGMPICVGAAPSKTLAKLYNKRAKEHGGVFVYDEETVDSLLADTPTSTIWNVGPATVAKLSRYGIRTALDLKHMNLSLAKEKLNVNGANTVLELNGKRCIDLVERDFKEVITSSRQFGKRVFDLASLECAAVEYAELAVERLRKQNSECSLVQVHLSTCSFSHPQDLPEEAFSDSAMVKLSRMSSYTPLIAQAALECVRRLYQNGFGYRTVMVSLCGIQPAAFQGELFVDPKLDMKRSSFMKTLDRINTNYGRNAIELCTANAYQGWQMRREFLSPCYTTRLSCLPGIK